MRTRLLAAVAAAGLLALVLPAAAGASHFPRPYEIQLSVEGLAPLDGAFYELWAVHGNRKISAGSFNVSDGELVDGFGHPARFFSPRNPANADAIVVTIEPTPDPSRKPSGIAVLTGTANKNRATLRFPVKLGTVAGSFILATPTDADTADETAGVWFLDPAAGPGPSLILPALPDGWVWEGWGVTQGMPLSTGRFTDATGADESSLFSGPMAGPPFPGEDFLMNLPPGVAIPVDLADGSSLVVLTVEPDLGGVDPTGDGPFSIKPLVAEIPAGAADHMSMALSRDLSSVPSGAATY
jgi:hypothetical protein